MANTQSDKPTGRPRIKVEEVGKDKVMIEFQVEELLTQLIHRVTAASCKGCKGCMAAIS